MTAEARNWSFCSDSSVPREPTLGDHRQLEGALAGGLRRAPEKSREGLRELMPMWDRERPRDRIGLRREEGEEEETAG